MGLERCSVGFLVAAKRLGVDLQETLMLGRQSLLVDQPRLAAGFKDGGMRLSSADARTMLMASAGYAEPLLKYLGASYIDSVDINDYEHSTIVHDLNQPLPVELHARFSTVLDGGTLEHVFDYPRALGHALDAVKVGGHFVAIAPTNGYLGHGFYQLSPELFYRVLTPENGFRMVCVLLKPLHWRSRWYRVPDPVSTGGRIVWRGSWPTLLYVVAKRVELGPVLERPALQSDYLETWKTETPASPRARTGLMVAVKSRLPLAIREIRDSQRMWRTSRSKLPVIKLTDL
jgi:hypothetical protein